MIKFKVRLCTSSMCRILIPCGKLIGLLFCLLLFLFSVLFFKPNLQYFIRNELVRPVIGNIFLVTCTTSEQGNVIGSVRIYICVQKKL